MLHCLHCFVASHINLKKTEYVDVSIFDFSNGCTSLVDRHREKEVQDWEEKKV
jgi:hypothetical protein